MQKSSSPFLLPSSKLISQHHPKLTAKIPKQTVATNNIQVHEWDKKQRTKSFESISL